MTGPAIDSEAARVLGERARVLAAPLELNDLVETVGVLLVAIAGQQYAFELDHVVAIERAAGLTPVPGVPAIWSGIANVHGALKAVLDLRLYLGAKESGAQAEGMVVLVHGAGIDIGLLVDEVLDVSTFRADAIVPSPSTPQRRAVVRGVTTDLIAVVDVEALLSDPALSVNDEAS